MSNTLPKHNWNLNCLSYGTNLLFKLDIVDILRTQFERFEYHFRNDEHVVYDAKLPLFILEIFSKFFKLWVDFPDDLHEVVPKSKFHEIFLELSSFFQIDAARLEKEDQLVRNSNEKFAVSVPEDSIEKGEIETPRRRAKFPSNFLLSSEPHKTEPQIINGSSEILNGAVSQLDSILDIGTFQETTLKLSSNDSSVRSPEDTIFEDALSHSTIPDDTLSSSSRMEFPNLIEKNESTEILFKIPSEDDRHCGPCCRNLTGKEYIKEHLMSMKHRKNVNLMTEGVLCLNGNKPYIVLNCERTFDFLCLACNVKQAGTNCLIQHCASKTHTNILKNLSWSSPRRP